MTAPVTANNDITTGEKPMVKRLGVGWLVPALLMFGCSGGGDPTPQVAAEEPVLDAAVVLENVISAMGTADVESITFSGTAWRVRNSFRQTYSASPPWPERDEITNYRRTLDLSQPASIASGDTFAQNLFLEPPVAGTYSQHIPGDERAWGQQLEIWLTPWGFLAGAERNGVELETATVDGVDYTVLSWQSPADQTAPSGLRYTVNGYVNAANLIERVETWVEDPFMGDMLVEARYAGYRDFAGVMVPTTMEQWRGGGAIFGVSVTDTVANPVNLAELMTPPPRPAGGPGGSPAGRDAPAELAERIGDGVWLIHGGYVALVAEFSDHVLVFEAGQSEARGEQILAEVKRILPEKPIRYVVNSHPHSDHTAGLVPFVREGVTIVTHENNIDFLDMALSTPRTLLGEPALEPQFEGVGELGVFEDETMRVELHHVPNLHSDGTLVAYVPKAKVLFQADFTLPREGARPNPFVVSLAEYVEQKGLDFERYFAVHAAPAPQTKADLMAALAAREE